MKLHSTYVRTITHAKYIVSEYSINHPSFWRPCRGSYGRWTISWTAKKNDQMMSINMILFPNIVKVLLEKYGKTIEDIFILNAKQTKDKEFVSVLWKNLNDEKRKKFMADLLGGK